MRVHLSAAITVGALDSLPCSSRLHEAVDRRLGGLRLAEWLGVSACKRTGRVRAPGAELPAVFALTALRFSSPVDQRSSAQQSQRYSPVSGRQLKEADWERAGMMAEGRRREALTFLMHCLDRLAQACGLNKTFVLSRVDPLGSSANHSSSRHHVNLAALLNARP